MYGTPALVTTFDSLSPSLNVVIPSEHIPCPSTEGLAKVELNRKFLTNFGKNLNWVKVTFNENGNIVQAQIMKSERQQAACNLLKAGAAVAFANENNA